MIIIQYNYRNGKEQLKLFSLNDGYYTVQRELYAPIKNEWIYYETLHHLKSKTDIIKYLLEKDSNLDLNQFINYTSI